MHKQDSWLEVMQVNNDYKEAYPAKHMDLIIDKDFFVFIFFTSTNILIFYGFSNIMEITKRFHYSCIWHGIRWP